jgi:hypothetical protein
MSDILSLDINELVSGEIREKISSLEATIEAQAKTIRDQRAEIQSISLQIVRDRDSIALSEALCATYSSITDSIEGGERKYDTDDKKYSFIACCMELVYGRRPVYQKYRNGGRYQRAAVQFHPWKDELLSIVRVLEPKDSANWKSIPGFKMPWEWSIDAIRKWASNPPYSTNGSMFDLLYWTGGAANAPFHLVMKSPRFSDESVFSAAIDAIKAGRGESDSLFRLTEFNTGLGEDKIKRLVEVALEILPKRNPHSCVHGFLTRHMSSLGDLELRELLQFAQHGNQYSNYFWLRFPEKYQKIYLMEWVLHFEGIQKALSDHACTWAMDQKESFWREYFLTNAGATNALGGA